MILWVCVWSTCYMEMMNSMFILVLCNGNEWNLFTNSQSTIMESIKNVVTYKKQNFTTNFSLKN